MDSKESNSPFTKGTGPTRTHASVTYVHHRWSIPVNRANCRGGNIIVVGFQQKDCCHKGVLRRGIILVLIEVITTPNQNCEKKRRLEVNIVVGKRLSENVKGIT